MLDVEHSFTTSTGPTASGSIPVATGRFFSWEIALRRHTRTAGDLASLYDGASKSWVRTAQRFRLETAYRDPLVASGAAEVLARPDTQVLDCGIGSGSLSLALARIVSKPLDYHGIDTSGAMLATADAEMQRAGILAQLKQANICKLPYPDRTFDVVMAAHVLEHLPEPRVALHEMCRVLKPGGVLFSCMTRPSLYGAFVQLHWRTWAVSEQQGVEWLQESGLKDVGFQSIGLGFGAGRASTAFWARKPVTPVCPLRDERAAPRIGQVR